MQVPKYLTRLRLGLVTCLVLAVAGVLVAGAAADATVQGGGLPPGPASGPRSDVGRDSFDPQQTNLPYLAWRGEEIRVVKCDPLLNILSTDDVITITERGWLVGGKYSLFIEDWSGTQNNSYEGPKPVEDTFSVFRAPYGSPHYGETCVAGDFLSNKAGLAIIKLSASTGNGVQVLVHEFLAGWMAVNSGNITNPGSVTEPAGAEPGNSVNVQVTGSMPMNAEFQSDWGLPDPLVLPRDWRQWAEAMATTDQDLQNTGNPASAYWDIHDSSGPTLGSEAGDGGTPDIHVSQTTCPGSTPSTTIDQVDNCNGPGSMDGIAFSRVFGNLGSGLGPFDQSYPSTLLSDGNLNSFDAPMPALKIVFNSAGGMGGFEDSPLNDKTCVYARDTTGTDCVGGPVRPNSAHNLYAPYYGRYIPATSRDSVYGLIGQNGIASGTDGPILSNLGPYEITGQPNNFPGYQWWGFYHYWQIATTLTQAMGGDSGCLLRGDEQRQLNDGATQVVEYTDEHGEARAQWVPGVNADIFGTLTPDENGGCDIQGLQLPAQTLTASARYPFQTVSRDIPVGGSITKNIVNLFNKSVVCHQKNATGTLRYVCVASAQDINGRGDTFNGEEVCFTREPDNIWFYYPGGGPTENGTCVDLAGGTATLPATATLETPATLVGSQVDVEAWFSDEKIGRDTCITVGQPVSLPGPCGGTVGGTTTTGSTTTGSTTTGSTTTGTTGISSLHGKLTTRRASSVQSVQLVLTRNGRVLKVKIHSINKTAKIRIRLINAHGKVITVALRSVKTNKLVKVSGLRIGKNVKSVRVQLVN
jgi:hypothetical protein